MGLQIAFAAIGALFTAKSYFDQQDARKEQQKALEQQATESRAQYAETKAANERKLAEEKKIAEVQNVRAVRSQIRSQRAAAGSILARAATGGTMSSTGTRGGIAGTQSQMTGNLAYMSDIAQSQEQIAKDTASYQDWMQGSATRMGDYQRAYGKASGDLAEASAGMQIGQTIFSDAGGFKTLFGGNVQANVNKVS